MTREQEFAEWLKSENVQPFRAKSVTYGSERTTAIIKAPYSEDFSYLYTQSDNKDNGLRRECALEYAGIYCKKDGKLYDVKWQLKDIFPKMTFENTASEMVERLNENVRRKAEQKLANDKNNLSLKELSKEEKANLDIFKRSYMEDEVRDLFLYGMENDAIRYHCGYRVRNLQDEDVLQYIADPESYEDKEAEKYIAENQEKILLEFMKNELIKAKLQILEQAEDSPYHRLRNIQEAVNRSDAKAVSVTVNKDGHTLTFKMLAEYLSRTPYGNEFSTYGLSPQDRATFERTFGYNAKIAPEEITDISYRGKSIYTAEPFEPQQDETEEFVQKL